VAGLADSANGHTPPDISCVSQHAAQGRGVPDGLSFSARDPALLQTAADLAQAEPVVADPVEHGLNDLSLVRNHIEACHPATLILGHITVPKRRRGERTQQARARRMTASAPTALEDLGAFIFGNHALHLQQQVVLGCAVDGTVQEDNLGAAASELLHQQGLMSIAAGQPVGRKHIKPRDASRSHRIAQPFECRANEQRTAVAVVDVGVIGFELTSVSCDPLT